MASEKVDSVSLTDKNVESPAKTMGKLSWPTRFAYAGGDVACNIVFGMVGSLLTLFYTDYVGITPAAIGIVMLISRIFDGSSDVAMGFIVEHTHSRWGKSRPWILWMALPYALSAVLLFTVPHTDFNLQIIYIFVTYNFCTTVCYTALNLPYGSLSAMMTRLSEERTMLSVVRMGLSPLGRVISVSFTLPLVKLFGDTQMAWIETMSIWAFIAIVLLLICFFRCKETVKINVAPQKRKVPVRKSLKALACNQYFWAVVLLWMMQSVTFTITGTVLPYHCKYIFGNDNLYSVVFLVEIFTLIICIFLCTPLINKFGKRNVALAGGIIALATQVIFIISPANFEWLIFSCIGRSIGLAPLNAVVFGMVGDAVEFGQWKAHIRQEGLVFAGGSVGTKIGAGLASAIITSLMTASGFVSSTVGGAVQPDSALFMIKMLYFVGPLVIASVVVIVLFMYHLDDKYDGIMKELAKRESNGEL